MNRRDLYSLSAWRENIKAIVSSGMFWRLTGIMALAAGLIYLLPVRETGMFMSALLSGFAVANVITHFNIVREFFDPHEGRRTYAHWYGFGEWMFWAFVMVAQGYRYAFVYQGRPAVWSDAPFYNMILLIGVMAASLQLLTPYLDRDHSLDSVRVISLSKNVAHVAIIIGIIVTVVLLLVAAPE